MKPGGRVLVTGAASGIGRAVCGHLALRGAAVAGLDRDAAALHEVVEGLRGTGATVVAAVADVADFESLDEAIRAAAAALGGLDAAVNVAGVGGYTGDVAATPLATWSVVMAVNLTGVFNVCRSIVPLLREAGGGAIVNVSSQYGLVGCAGSPAYCASKAGVIGLTRALAIDHAEESIRANCICPGPIETPLLAASNAQAEAGRRELERTRGRLLMKRPGSPEEVAEAVEYVLGAAFMTGSVISLDGGWTAG